MTIYLLSFWYDADAADLDSCKLAREIYVLGNKSKNKISFYTPFNRICERLFIRERQQVM